MHIASFDGINGYRIGKRWKYTHKSLCVCALQNHHILWIQNQFYRKKMMTSALK